MRPTYAYVLALASCFSTAAAQQAPNDPEVVARISKATVLILAGEGAGRLSSISTGVIVRPDGVILCAYHALKDAREVQVRLHSGDIYDQVVLLGVDERRDVAHRDGDWSRGRERQPSVGERWGLADACQSAVALVSSRRCLEPAGPPAKRPDAHHYVPLDVLHT